jgi:hypothetical protein
MPWSSQKRYSDDFFYFFSTVLTRLFERDFFRGGGLATGSTGACDEEPLTAGGGVFTP